MKLEKAIETNNKVLTRLSYNMNKSEVDSLKLGIEALKWFKEWRAPQYPAPYIRLPGETEE